MPGTPEYEESMRLWGDLPAKLVQMQGIPEGITLGHPVPLSPQAQLEWKPWLSDLYNHHGGGQGEQAGFVKLVGALSVLCQRRFG